MGNRVPRSTRARKSRSQKLHQKHHILRGLQKNITQLRLRSIRIGDIYRRSGIECSNTPRDSKGIPFCYLCGAYSNLREGDHIIPALLAFILGCANDPSNYAFVHPGCNKNKGNKLYLDMPSWELARENVKIDTLFPGEFPKHIAERTLAYVKAQKDSMTLRDFPFDRIPDKVGFYDNTTIFTKKHGSNPDNIRRGYEFYRDTVAYLRDKYVVEKKCPRFIPATKDKYNSHDFF